VTPGSRIFWDIGLSKSKIGNTPLEFSKYALGFREYHMLLSKISIWVLKLYKTQRVQKSRGDQNLKEDFVKFYTVSEKLNIYEDVVQKFFRPILMKMKYPRCWSLIIVQKITRKENIQIL